MDGVVGTSVCLLTKGIVQKRSYLQQSVALTAPRAPFSSHKPVAKLFVMATGIRTSFKDQTASAGMRILAFLTDSFSWSASFAISSFPTRSRR
jgi:hypothetical protein